jgi:hypothetical protein
MPAKFGRRNVVMDDVLEGMFRAALVVLHPKLSLNALLGMGVFSPSDVHSVSLAITAGHFRQTHIFCADLRLHFPLLEQAYRDRRHSLASDGLAIAASKLLLSSRRIARKLPFRHPAPLLRYASVVAAAAGVRLRCRILRFLLGLIPGPFWRLEDRAIRRTARLMLLAMRKIQDIEALAATATPTRPHWCELELLGKCNLNEQDTALPNLCREALGCCPTRVAKLILLSTWKDNNTGKYYCARLSDRFGNAEVSSALEDLHREICDEVLRCRLPELVEELELYAGETPADRELFLRSWKGTRAYRVAKPTNVDVLTSSFFELTLEIAVAAMDSRALRIPPANGLALRVAETR